MNGSPWRRDLVKQRLLGAVVIAAVGLAVLFAVAQLPSRSGADPLVRARQVLDSLFPFLPAPQPSGFRSWPAPGPPPLVRTITVSGHAPEYSCSAPPAAVSVTLPITLTYVIANPGPSALTLVPSHPVFFVRATPSSASSPLGPAIWTGVLNLSSHTLGASSVVTATASWDGQTTSGSPSRRAPLGTYFMDTSNGPDSLGVSDGRGTWTQYAICSLNIVVQH